MRGLEGKRAIVTGAGGVIGRAISARLAEAGVFVGAFDKNGEAANETVNRLGAPARASMVDITDYAAVDGAVSAFEQEVGPVDILVNNAGWDRVANFVDTTPELWDQLIAINLRGPLNMHHVVVRRMVERRSGRIVNIASDAGRVGSSGESVYSACKGGIIAFSKTLARELASAQINVNVVAPGPTESPILDSFLGEGEQGKKISRASSAPSHSSASGAARTSPAWSLSSRATKRRS